MTTGQTERVAIRFTPPGAKRRKSHAEFDFHLKNNGGPYLEMEEVCKYRPRADGGGDGEDLREKGHLRNHARTYDIARPTDKCETGRGPQHYERS